MNLALNHAQRILLDTYEYGEFKHIRTSEQLDDCGDTLFRFLFLETSYQEGCTSLDEAFNRLRVARDQIDNVMTAIDKDIL